MSGQEAFPALLDPPAPAPPAPAPLVPAPAPAPPALVALVGKFFRGGAVAVQNCKILTFSHFDYKRVKPVKPLV
jgi:hypothetical protein